MLETIMGKMAHANIKSRAVSLALALILTMPLNSHGAPNLAQMRAVHMEGNWGGNTDGIKNISDAYIRRLKDDHVNYVAITLPIFSASISDPTIQIRYRPSNSVNYTTMYSFDDADLINAITKLKQNGINVYMSLAILQSQFGLQSGTCHTAQYEVDPHLLGDPELPNSNNSQGFEYQCIDPALWWWNPSHPDHASNVEKFWSTYTQVVVHYARMAQQLGVGMLGLGEESDRLFRTRSTSRFPTHFKNELSQMVAAVRAEYTGLLTYGQNGVVYSDHPEWWGYDFTASGALFNDLSLDVVGLSYYFSLTPSTVTSVLPVAQLETAWTSLLQKTLGRVQANNPKIPIVFTSTGTTDSVNAPYQPLDQAGAPYVFSDLNNNGVDDGMEQQANIYQALFNVNTSNNNLVSGLFFFGYVIDTNPYTFAANNSTRNSELHGRPAEQVIRGAYGQLDNSDCIFNWAERTYQPYFSPPVATSATYAPYYYRYYSGTGNYLATSSADNHLWVLGPSFGNGLLDVGPVTSFLGLAGCQ